MGSTASGFSPARALGLGEVEPTAAELDRLIFEPGVSTAGSVTQLSGRGVGLDVVRRNVESLRGTVSVRSAHGAGTTLTLRLPLTLAVVVGLDVAVGEETFVVPLDAVLECVDLPASHAVGDEGQGVLSLRGEPLPFVRLGARFGCAGSGAGREKVVVVRSGEGAAGLAVDEVLGESQAVVKPLGRTLRALPGVSGATIRGDGRVALILDVEPLLRPERTAAASSCSSGRPGPVPAPRCEGADRC